jgi:hypothetical protein
MYVIEIVPLVILLVVILPRTMILLPICGLRWYLDVLLWLWVWLRCRCGAIVYVVELTPDEGRGSLVACYRLTIRTLRYWLEMMPRSVVFIVVR